ncbi:hypothetical protein [Paraburkholderia aromaticivorans]|uniref:hypothetical protein n=1 Tax=Paraburkholderia aromaticivorans TaxID=2026199 RepID=UPI0019820AB5|nr:hypothetical protein [Paraburkholderia aromaticivorans]
MIQILFADGSACSRRMKCRHGDVGNAAAAALTIKPLRQQKNQSFCICKARHGRKAAHRLRALRPLASCEEHVGQDGRPRNCHSAMHWKTARLCRSDSDAPHDINRRAAEEQINSGLHICRRWLVLSLKYRCFSAYSREFIDINIEFDCLFHRFVLLIVCRRLQDVHRSITSPTLSQHQFK